MFLVGNIAGSLIAFLAFVAFLNGLLGWFGGLVGAPFLSFEFLLGWVFYPLAFIMGVPCGRQSDQVGGQVVGGPPDTQYSCMFIGSRRRVSACCHTHWTEDNSQ